jgi:hypothetical protein
VRYTLEQVERFTTTRKVSAFAGFDPMQDQTDERNRMGAISKHGFTLAAVTWLKPVR